MYLFWLPWIGFWHFVWLTCKQWDLSLWNMFSMGSVYACQVCSADLRGPWGTQNGLSRVIKVRLCSSLSKWIYFSVWVSGVSWGLNQRLDTESKQWLGKETPYSWMREVCSPRLTINLTSAPPVCLMWIHLISVSESRFSLRSCTWRIDHLWIWSQHNMIMWNTLPEQQLNRLLRKT